MGILGEEWTSDRRLVRLQSRYVSHPCGVECVCVAVLKVHAETDDGPVCYRLQTLHHCFL